MCIRDSIHILKQNVIVRENVVVTPCHLSFLFFDLRFFSASLRAKMSNQEVEKTKKVVATIIVRHELILESVDHVEDSA